MNGTYDLFPLSHSIRIQTLFEQKEKNDEFMLNQWLCDAVVHCTHIKGAMVYTHQGGHGKNVFVEGIELGEGLFINCDCQPVTLFSPPVHSGLT